MSTKAEIKLPATLKRKKLQTEARRGLQEESTYKAGIGTCICWVPGQV